MTPDERIAELEAENAALRAQVREVPGLREQVTLLLGRVRDLEARLAKDSHNSGKPPSSDGLARQPRPRRTKSLRTPSGKTAGGQVGHRGAPLRLVATDQAGGVVEQRPAVCAACHQELPPEAEVVLRERRQVQDLPPVRLVVTEHQALRVRCPACQAVTAGTFPTEAPSRAQYGPRLRALAVYLAQAQFVPLGRV